MPDSKAKLGNQVIAGLREEAKQEAQSVVKKELGIKPQPINRAKLGIGRKLQLGIHKVIGTSWLVGRGEPGSLEGISNVLSDIIGILREQNRILKKEEQDEQKKAQAERRKKREEALENVKGLLSSVKQIIQPLRNIWERLFTFLKFTFLGKIITDLVKFFTNYKKNEDKINLIGRFLKDWGPLLATLGVIFFTPLGTFLAATLSLLTWAIPALVGLMVKNPWLLAVGAGYGIGKMLGKDKVVENETARANTSRTALEKAESTKDLSAGDIEALVQGTRLPDAGGPGSLNNMPDQFNDPLGLRNDPLGGVKFAQGGFVSGPAGVDKVPAKLTAGEFVMSKGAVNKWGASTLASMNAAGGGTNRPTMKDGRLQAEGGGLIDRQNLFGKDNWMESRKSAGGTSEWLPSRITKDNILNSINEHVTQRMQGATLEVTVRSGSESQNQSIISALDKIGAIGPPVSRTQEGKTTILPPVDATKGGDPAYDSGSKLPAFTIIDSNHYRERVVNSLGIRDLMGVA